MVKPHSSLARVSVLVVAIVIMVAALAQAHAVPTKVTIYTITGTITPAKADPYGAGGYITSPNDACLRRRVVKLFKVQPGDDLLIGHRRTDTHGNWSVQWTATPSEAQGNYYAVARAARRHSGDRRVRCRGARSRPYDVS
jgi:hypothetical protein